METVEPPIALLLLGSAAVIGVLLQKLRAERSCTQWLRKELDKVKGLLDEMKSERDRLLTYLRKEEK